jgi:hypothetical protein
MCFDSLEAMPATPIVTVDTLAEAIAWFEGSTPKTEGQHDPQALIMFKGAA